MTDVFLSFSSDLNLHVNCCLILENISGIAPSAGFVVDGHMNKIIHKFQGTIIHRNDDLWTGQKSKISVLKMWSDELCNRSGRPSRQKRLESSQWTGWLWWEHVPKNQLSVNLRMEVLWSAQVNDAELDVMYNCITHWCFCFLFRNLTQQLLNFERLEFASQCAPWQHCFAFLLQLHFAINILQIWWPWTHDTVGLWVMDHGRFTGFAAGLRRW